MSISLDTAGKMTGNISEPKISSKSENLSSSTKVKGKRSMSMVKQRAPTFNMKRAVSSKSAREKAEKRKAIEDAKPKKKDVSKFNFIFYFIYKLK